MAELIELNQDAELIEGLDDYQYQQLEELRDDRAAEACENCRHWRKAQIHGMPGFLGYCRRNSPAPAIGRGEHALHKWPLTHGTDDFCTSIEFRPFDWEAEARRLIENG
jgi:hypothetical protein